MSRPGNRNACTVILARPVLAVSAKYRFKLLVLRGITAIGDPCLKIRARCQKWTNISGGGWKKEIQKYCNEFQPDFHIRYIDGEKHVGLKYENGTYVFVEKVEGVWKPFRPSEDAPRGTKKFLEELIYDGWKPDWKISIE
jgi:hypothetical protein